MNTKLLKTFAEVGAILNMKSIQKAVGRSASLWPIGLCLILCGCKPSEKEGEQAVQQQIDRDSGNHMSLNWFKKTNGQEGEVNGTQEYAMSFEAGVGFVNNCKWVTGIMGSLPTFRVIDPPSGAFSEAALTPGTVVAAGEQWKLVGTISFFKTENGWAVNGVTIGQATKQDLMDMLRAPQKQQIEISPVQIAGIVGMIGLLILAAIVAVRRMKAKPSPPT
jgi:hypothetical protein